MYYIYQSNKESKKILKTFKTYKEAIDELPKLILDYHMLNINTNCTNEKLLLKHDTNYPEGLYMIKINDGKYTLYEKKNSFTG